MIKQLSQKILLCFAIASFGGCSIINISQNLSQDASFQAEFDDQGKLIDCAKSSDGIPYTIVRYLDQITIVRNTQTEERQQ